MIDVRPNVIRPECNAEKAIYAVKNFVKQIPEVCWEVVIADVYPGDGVNARVDLTQNYRGGVAGKCIGI